MALHVPPVANETDALHAFLAQAQDAFRTLLHGLTPRQASLSPSASSLSVGGLVKHVTSVQRSWLAGAEAAPDLPGASGDVDDVDAALADLLARGATVHEDVRDFGGGYRGAVVTDPFGNALGMMQRPATATTGAAGTNGEAA